MTMINSPEVSDLQLEDVEDYSADYPPVGFPQAEDNIAAVGMDPNGDHSPKKRTSQLCHMMRVHKWTTAMVGLAAVILIVVIAIAGGSSKATAAASSSAASSSSSTVLSIDPKSLDPKITEPLMGKLLAAYDRKGLDSSALDKDAGDTPQRKAFYWLASDISIHELDHTETIQRYALATFYYATNYVPNEYEKDPGPWITAHLWLSDAHSCEWFGIVCNESKHASSIDLERNNMSGELPNELGFLGEQLTTLDLTSNLIYVAGNDWDVFRNLPQLETFLMDDNYLFYDQGLPPQLHHLEKIKKLRLSYNLFKGQLETHEVLAYMTELTHLEIESNFLSGTMPAVLGQLSNLVYIYMRRNDLQFNLDFLKPGIMKDLFALWLDNNRVTGTIPTEIGKYSELASISITNTTLTGTIPTQIGNLTALRRLWLYSNKLTGDIPTQLSKLTDLEVLELQHNRIKGTMPQGVCTTISNSDYEFRSLTSDCKNKVECDKATCCTDCY